MLCSILDSHTICSRLRKKSCGFETICKLNDLLVTILIIANFFLYIIFVYNYIYYDPLINKAFDL